MKWRMHASVCCRCLSMLIVTFEDVRRCCCLWPVGPVQWRRHKNCEAQALRFPGHQISWVSEWVIEYAVFHSVGQLSNGGRERNKIWHKGSLGDEDDVRISSTRITQRKRVIPQSTMRSNRNIIQCCNNTHLGAPHTDKQMCCCTLNLGDDSRVTCQ